MGTSYVCLLDRLKEERKRLGLTQEELGFRAHMSQGHYSKAESGLNRFSHTELKDLRGAGIDLHYVYRGERLICPEYYEFFNRCGEGQAKYLAEAALPMIEHYASKRRVESEASIRYRTQNVKSLVYENEPKEGCYYRLRKFRGYSQRYMAGILGVDVKKYISYEKCRDYGDSEVLLQMCNHFQISPLLLMEEESGIVREVCSLIEGLGEEGGRVLFSCLQTVDRGLMERHM